MNIGARKATSGSSDCMYTEVFPTASEYPLIAVVVNAFHDAVAVEI